MLIHAELIEGRGDANDESGSGLSTTPTPREQIQCTVEKVTFKNHDMVKKKLIKLVSNNTS